MNEHQDFNMQDLTVEQKMVWLDEKQVSNLDADRIRLLAEKCGINTTLHHFEIVSQLFVIWHFIPVYLLDPREPTMEQWERQDPILARANRREFDQQLESNTAEMRSNIPEGAREPRRTSNRRDGPTDSRPKRKVPDVELHGRDFSHELRYGLPEVMATEIAHRPEKRLKAISSAGGPTCKPSVSPHGGTSARRLVGEAATDGTERLSHRLYSRRITEADIFGCSDEEDDSDDGFYFFSDAYKEDGYTWNNSDSSEEVYRRGGAAHSPSNPSFLNRGPRNEVLPYEPLPEPDDEYSDDEESGSPSSPHLQRTAPLSTARSSRVNSASFDSLEHDDFIGPDFRPFVPFAYPPEDSSDPRWLANMRDALDAETRQAERVQVEAQEQLQRAQFRAIVAETRAREEMRGWRDLVEEIAKGAGKRVALMVLDTADRLFKDGLPAETWRDGAPDLYAMVNALDKGSERTSSNVNKECVPSTPSPRGKTPSDSGSLKRRRRDSDDEDESDPERRRRSSSFVRRVREMLDEEGRTFKRTRR